MASSVSLACYTVSVRERGSQKPVNLDSIGDDDIDLVNLLNDYLNGISTDYSLDEESKKVVKVNDCRRSDRTLCGTVQTGEHGYESQLLNVETGVIAHTRDTKEAEMLPFYYLIDVPKNCTKGVVILQRFRQFGIRKLLFGDLDHFFANRCYGYIIDVRPIMPEKLLHHYLNNARLTEVRFIKYKMSKDLADVLLDQNPECIEEDAYLQLSIKAKRKKTLPFSGVFKDFSKGHKDPKGLFEINGFNYDVVKIDLSINGRRKVIDLENMEKLRSNVDISNDVVMGKNGHPTFESIDMQAQQLLTDLKEEFFKQGHK